VLAHHYYFRPIAMNLHVVLVVLFRVEAVLSSDRGRIVSISRDGHCEKILSSDVIGLDPDFDRMQCRSSRCLS